MATRPSSNLQKWFNGQKNLELSFEDQWKLFLLRIADRVTDMVDEKGRSISTGRRSKRPYFYDLEKIGADDDLVLPRSTIRKIAQYLVDNDFATLKAGTRKNVALTRNGFSRAEEINDEIFNQEPLDRSSWSFGANDTLHNWLLFHGFRAFDLGSPVSASGMVNFRAVADHHPRRITDRELDSVLNDLEYRDMVATDTGPTEGGRWAHFNHGGEVAAKLIEEIWTMRARLPAADRFVRLDDNSPKFKDAVAALERLVMEMGDIRVNDWPEKEGMLTVVGATIEMLKTKYVNRATILAAISSVVTFLVMKFVDAPVSELANKAWSAIKALF